MASKPERKDLRGIDPLAMLIVNQFLSRLCYAKPPESRAPTIHTVAYPGLGDVVFEANTALDFGPDQQPGERVTPGGIVHNLMN